MGLLRSLGVAPLLAQPLVLPTSTSSPTHPPTLTRPRPPLPRAAAAAAAAARARTEGFPQQAGRPPAQNACVLIYAPDAQPISLSIYRFRAPGLRGAPAPGGATKPKPHLRGNRIKKNSMWR